MWGRDREGGDQSRFANPPTVRDLVGVHVDTFSSRPRCKGAGWVSPKCVTDHFDRPLADYAIAR